jgi:hypothetical protein
MQLPVLAKLPARRTAVKLSETTLDQRGKKCIDQIKYEGEKEKTIGHGWNGEIWKAAGRNAAGVELLSC